MREISPRRLRSAVFVYFFLSGFSYSSWTSRIPDVKESLHLDDAHFGSLLFLMPVGLILTMPFTGKLLDRYPSRQIMLIGAIGYNIVLGCLGFPRLAWVLGGLFFFFGSFRNLMNLSMNAQAIGVQARYTRSIMSTFHAIWSLAGFAGAGLGYLMVVNNVLPPWHLLGISLLVTAVTLYFFKDTLNETPLPAAKKPLFALPPKDMLPFSLICFGSMACENTMYDWSGIFIRQVLHAPSASATIAFVVYMVAMTTGRLLGDRAADRFGIRTVLRASGILIFCGLTITVVSPLLPVTLAGYVLTGFGVSCVVPFVFGLAGKIPMANPGAALASISSIGYLGFLLIPPMIGYVAQWTNLRVSFGIISLMGLFIFAMCRNIPDAAPGGAVNPVPIAE